MLSLKRELDFEGLEGSGLGKFSHIGTIAVHVHSFGTHLDDVPWMSTAALWPGPGAGPPDCA